MVHQVLDKIFDKVLEQMFVMRRIGDWITFEGLEWIGKYGPQIGMNCDQWTKCGSEVFPSAYCILWIERCLLIQKNNKQIVRSVIYQQIHKMFIDRFVVTQMCVLTSRKPLWKVGGQVHKNVLPIINCIVFYHQTPWLSGRDLVLWYLMQRRAQVRILLTAKCERWKWKIRVHLYQGLLAIS